MSGAAAVPNASDEALLARFRANVAADLAIFQTLHDSELSQHVLASLKSAPFESFLGLQPTTAGGREALRALEQAIEQLPAPDETKARDQIDADYADVYLRHAYRAAPTESVWLDPDGLERQGPMFSVRAWYRRFGFAIHDPARRPDDHIAHELRYLASLFSGSEGKGALEASAAFLDAHLLQWLPAFARRLVELEGPPFYTALAVLTAVYLDELRDHLTEITGCPRQSPAKTEARKTAEMSCAGRYIPGTAPSW